MVNTYELTFALLGVLLMPLADAVNISFSLFEEQPGMTFVGNLTTAIDRSPDGDPIWTNGTFVLVDGPFSVDFLIQGDALYTKTPIDREKVCPFSQHCLIHLTIFTHNVGNYFRSFGVTVRVVDINDNAPVFPVHDFTLTIPENAPLSTVYRLPAASDADTGYQDDTLTYEIRPSVDEFRLKTLRNADGTSRLGLTLARRLDREVMNMYQLTIIAVDGSLPPLTGSMVVSIQVTDVNDNAPVFYRRTYNAVVKSDILPGTAVLRVNAVDADVGDNARISYTLAFEQTLFTIDHVTGVVSTIRLLGNLTGEIQFQVVATDHGLPYLISNAPVTIEVIDVDVATPVVG